MANEMDDISRFFQTSDDFSEYLNQEEREQLDQLIAIGEVRKRKSLARQTLVRKIFDLPFVNFADDKGAAPRYEECCNQIEEMLDMIEKYSQ
jgi:hypothetical protein